MKFKKLEKHIKNYIKDESGAMSSVEYVLLILFGILVAGFVVSWLWGMVQANTSKGTEANNNFNNIIDGIR